jgi:predicted 3-demethylubiquinone-9 3-methyltransferase (glyoxalase superfamily)
MQTSIYPCLWFDNNANEAAKYYCNLFPNTQILQETPLVTTFEIKGTKFMGLNGGPLYQKNSSISFFVYGGGDYEITRLYNELIQGGTILMPLDKYEWSPKYAWVSDKFGVNWQLDIDQINSSQKVVPALMFANQKRLKVKEAIVHYTSIFSNSKILLEAPYSTDINPSADILLFAQVKLDGYILNAMSSMHAHDFDFTPAISLVIECDNQQEIDYYWDNLGKGGTYSMCGWLEDKFGVSWQIVPKVLSSLMADEQKAPKVIQAFLKMQKFDIETLLKQV